MVLYNNHNTFRDGGELKKYYREEGLDPLFIKASLISEKRSDRKLWLKGIKIKLISGLIDFLESFQHNEKKFE